MPSAMLVYHAPRTSAHTTEQLGGCMIMVICAIVGCSNTSKRGKGNRFFRLPAVIAHQGEKAKEVSEKRRNLWLSCIHRLDLTPDKYSNTLICHLHFVAGIYMQVQCSYINTLLLSDHNTIRERQCLCCDECSSLLCLGEPSQLFDENNVDWASSVDPNKIFCPQLHSSCCLLCDTMDTV